MFWYYCCKREPNCCSLLMLWYSVHRYHTGKQSTRLFSVLGTQTHKHTAVDFTTHVDSSRVISPVVFWAHRNKGCIYLVSAVCCANSLSTGHNHCCSLLVLQQLYAEHINFQKKTVGIVGKRLFNKITTHKKLTVAGNMESWIYEGSR